ncbi:MAG: hypothetical protein WA821_21750 [Anaerolineales bacterium]
MESPNIAPDAFPVQPEPKKNNTTMIIIIVVVVVLCCCCVAILGGAWVFGDQIMKSINY